MAFFIPREALTPRHRLKLDVDPAARILRAGELAAWLEAEQAVSVAREQAQTIVSETQAAFEAERRRGWEEGTETAHRERVQHMAEQIARTDEYFSRIEERMTELVMQAVRRIVNDYTDHEKVVYSVRNAMAAVRNQKQITLRVHPDNVEHVKSQASHLLAEYPAVGLLDVVPDPRMARDACVLESDIGVVEASTEGQLAALEAAFRNARAAHA